MKRTLVILTFALAALAASADRFATAAGSLVRIEGTSTLHAWTMEGSTIQGQIVSTTPDRWTDRSTDQGSSAPNAVVTIPVASIKSEHARMDKLMAEALNAKKFPEIRFELTGATPMKSGVESFVVKTHGKLTIAGQTREVSLEVQGSRNRDGRYTLTGQTPIKMTAFGITPPKAMLNTIRTGDDVKVTFRWIVEPAR